MGHPRPTLLGSSPLAELAGDATVGVASSAELAGDATVGVASSADLAGDATISVVSSAVAEVASLADLAKVVSSADLVEVASLADLAGFMTSWVSSRWNVETSFWSRYVHAITGCPRFPRWAR